MGKISFIAGVGVGYVLGAAAGRQRYEQIKSAASKTWNNPKVQQGADAATDQAVKGAKAATSAAKDAASGTSASGLVDKAAAKVEEKTGADVASGTPSSSAPASSGTASSATAPKGGKAPSDGTARFANTDRDATGSGKASDDSGFAASNATPGVAPAAGKGPSKA